MEDFEEFKERKYIILVIYDISNNKQRLKVAKYLQSFGIRVQKSAFEANLNKKQFDKLISGLKGMLMPEDNVRIYKLRSYEEVIVFGSEDYAEIEDVLII